MYLLTIFSNEHALRSISENSILQCSTFKSSTFTGVVFKDVFLKSTGSPKVVTKNIVNRKLLKSIRCVSSLRNI